MSRRLLTNALRPVERHMGSALGQAMLRMHGRGISGSVDEETFQRLIREQEEAYAEALEQERKRQGMPLPYPSLRPEDYTCVPAKLPHYPDAYLESKHTQPFAHWRSPKGVAEWTGFLAAQAFNAAAAAVAHVPSWLIRIPRDTVWFRRLLLLECIMPVPGAIASMAGHMRSLATLRGPGAFVRSYGRESENAHEHLLTLLQLRPSLALRALVLASQAVFVVPYMAAYLISPRACHAFVCHLSGLTGEAISDALHDLDAGTVPAWQRSAVPASAAAYWGLPEGATMRMVLLVMRADMIARTAINQAADIATFKPGCQLATVEDILNEEYPLDYNLPDGPAILRSQSNASSISDAGSSLSGSRKDFASPTAAPTLRRAHSAARSAFQDATPAKFGRTSSAPKTGADPKPPRNAPAAFRQLHRNPGAPAVTTIDLTEEEKDVQLHAAEDDKTEIKHTHKKCARAQLNTEGKQPDLAAIMDSIWGSTRF